MKKVKSKIHFHVAAGVIWENGKILITKRPEGTHLGGFWEFPGGKKEDNETLHACLNREILEELGIEIQIDGPLLVVHHEYNEKMITLHVYNCHLFSGKPLSMEGQEMKWVSVEDLRNYTFPPPDEHVINLLIREGSKFFHHKSMRSG